MSPPALVVGAGPNGLAAAIALAEAGRDVTVLEAAERAGGAVATEELTLPGFLHDRFSAVYPATVASPVFARMPLERHGLRWIHPRRCYAHPLPDGRAAALSADIDETAATLDALHPGDGEAWRAFATPYVKHFAAWRDTMLRGFPPVRGPARLLAAQGLGGLLDFAKLLLMPAHALAARLFADGGARAWLYGSAMHGDAPPLSAGSGIAAAHLNVMGHAVGWPSPEGGAGRIADALVGYLESLGGRVRTGARVGRIAVERGRAVGVELTGGERVGGSLIVADVTPGALLRLTGDALDGRYGSALRAWRLGPATLKVDWALDGPIPWTAPEAREAGTVHVGGSEPEVLEALQPVGARLHERPFMLLGQQSLADPTRAPAGKHTAWAYTHGPQEADWAGETDRQVERMEVQVERFAPGFRDRILARHVQGPADLERGDPNLEGGDVGAGSYALDQVVFRPVASLDPYRTPVRGLFLGSASTFPGGAVHGVCGDAAARHALAEARVRRF
ncbi:MAG TPA: NAD(P)/FAD-dependent oxidoreductase [Solirubrobacteraceae bacterium]|nr:NAD(P)/FAD-dependent oxidoreductase [Solirubrobacteraceae bacterium]